MDGTYSSIAKNQLKLLHYDGIVSVWKVTHVFCLLHFVARTIAKVFLRVKRYNSVNAIKPVISKHVFML